MSTNSSFGQELQQELVRLSSNSKQIIAEDTSHNIPGERPQLVVEAVREVIEAVRNKTPLTP